MKLLKKSIIDAEVNAKKKAQIDEGIQLAQKVDALRVDLNNIERQHREFIAGMEAQLKEKLDPLLEEIAERTHEIEELKVQKKRLLETFPSNYEEMLDEKDRLAVLRLKLDRDKKVLEEVLEKERKGLRNIKVRERELAAIIIKETKNETDNITNISS